MSITKRNIYNRKDSSLANRFEKIIVLFFFKWHYLMQDKPLLSPLYNYIKI